MIFKIIFKILLQQNINELSQNSKTSIYFVSQARTITRFKSFIDGNWELNKKSVDVSLIVSNYIIRCRGNNGCHVIIDRL